ncbi:hypothetical protein [Dysgonomonas sp. Marseille-P4361]|uniref:hypothetical protein n=1 Tax=Dysgonomonas sp. Marseille-P4361 TaxID=2161820 RepID=UPI001359FCD7|nr:hypothetical protein [Dysgonomonas sp. Marseille-P4361]
MAIKIILKNKAYCKFNKEDKVLDIIYKILIKENESNIRDYELERLKHKKARNYYNNYLLVVQKQSLKERIKSTLEFFKEKAKYPEKDDRLLYIGYSYGETIRNTERYINDKDEKTKLPKNVYIDLGKYINNTKYLVNLAIVKLKMEEDFVSYKLTQLIVFLYDFKIIDTKYYNQYIYGTTDSRTIELVRFGLNISVISKLIQDDQISNLTLDKNGNLHILPQSKKTFEKYLNSQPQLFQFEIRKYI